ncbi:hypothetical protein CRG98_025992 [Punica granatum]|uniref:Integrase catalytic domain-containing protein n=1 Tax=Punica granatum TaxID=22663 RepID=A0A2I0JBM5_PUNGR|nr:hypothetical protein CRG98_025992 [Punica granatum]
MDNAITINSRNDFELKTRLEEKCHRPKVGLLGWLGMVAPKRYRRSYSQEAAKRPYGGFVRSAHLDSPRNYKINPASNGKMDLRNGLGRVEVWGVCSYFCVWLSWVGDHPKMVGFTLHQKLKFFVEGKLITVNGKEDYAIYKGTAVPYVSIGEYQNLPFHSFDTISVIRDYGEVGPSRTDRLIGKVLLKNDYVPGTGLGARAQGILRPVEVRNIGIRGDSAFALLATRLYKHAAASTSTVSPLTTRSFPRASQSHCSRISFRDRHTLLEALLMTHPPNQGTPPRIWLKCSLHCQPSFQFLKQFAYTSKLQSNPNHQCNDLNSFEKHLEKPLSIYFEEGLDEDSQVPEIEESLHRLENHQLTSVEPTEEINIGTAEEPRTLRIGTGLDPAQRARMINFLTKYQEVFAWSYADMPGLDPSIVKHFLLLNTESFPPKRQHLRRQRADLLLLIKEEVIKQVDAGFLEVCNYSEWVANIVPVEKKNGKVRVCIDYRDLNRASPKDNFPLSHIDVLMAEEDKVKTTFITMCGTFCYKVMLFGLKNVGATYQRAMVTLFHDMMHKEIEVYVDDMIAKSKEGKIIRSTLSDSSSVSRRKLLGFIMSVKGIEVDPDKVKVIMELPPPSTVRETDPLQYLLDNPSSMRNIAKWRCQLTEYDIEYVSRTSVKGQAIVDHLAEFLIDDNTPINSDFPDEGILQLNDEEESPRWKMHFDGAVNSTRSGIGSVLISPEGRHFPVAAKIDFPCTNNVAEYEACILGLQAAVDLKWKTKDPKLVLYHEYLEELVENFEKVLFTYTLRMKNQFADALATLASMVSITKRILSSPSNSRLLRALPIAMRTLRRIAANFFLKGETLYRRSFNATLLRCVDENEAQRLMEEMHEGNYGPHMNGLMLAKKLMRLGYFWSTMETDCVKNVRHSIDYFTKWIEAITLASVTAKAVARFLKRDIIARYGVPTTLITDNAKNLNNKLIDELCAKFKIQHRNSSSYRPQMNDALRMARAFNKRVRPQEFSHGNLVLRKVLHISPNSKGKFAYKYDGPFIVKEVFDGGAIILNDMDGNENALPVNADALKKYYP